ncbi:uncharacterized protein [Clytia hemisphaerica]|uniref:uncharacterized protein n=1 Tax=Clytia hemisphaerica TaxID=252671 RepID=UPI0034D6C3CF
MFLESVERSLFQEGEMRTLKSLKEEYEQIREGFGILGETRTTFVKDCLVSKFGDRVVIQKRYKSNQSMIVFSLENSGICVESLINLWGISNAELFKATADRINKDFDSTNSRTWPPTVETLTETKNDETALKQFLDILIRNKERVNDTKVEYIKECIEFILTGNRTRLPIMMSVTVHGLTRSKEIIELMSDAGIGISYKDVMKLHDCWAASDLENNPVCPSELAEGKAGTAIIDNDDFKDDGLTGAETSHRTNMMFIQPESYIKSNLSKDTEQSVHVHDVTRLKNFTREQHKILKYSTSSRGAPLPINAVDITALSSSDSIRKKMFIHAALRIDESEKEVPDIGAFTGFMSSISPIETKSKPYYHVSLPKSPSKSVVYTLMKKAADAASYKRMPFIQFVGDQPVYTHMMELKYENSEMFEKVIPVLAPFHTQMSFISAIFKRINGSEISDLVVNAGLIAEGSAEQALKGKHYNRAQRLYKLIYESLARILINLGIDKEIKFPENLKSFMENVGDVNLNQESRLISFQAICFTQFHLRFLFLGLTTRKESLT